MARSPARFEADFVIVGANRLSADGKTRVLLLEAGADGRPG